MLFTSCSVFCFQPGHNIAGKPLLSSILEQLNPITQVWGYYYYYSPLLYRRMQSHSSFSFGWKDDMVINDDNMDWRNSSSWHSCQSHYHLEWIDLSKFSPWLLVSDSSLVYRLCHTIIHGHPYLSQQKRQRLDTRIVRHTLGRRSAARPCDPALHRQVGPPPWPLWSRSAPYVDRVFSMACDPWLQQLPLLSSNRPRETSPSPSRRHMFEIFMPTW